MKYGILNETKDAVVEVRHFDVLPPHKPGRVLPIVEAPVPVYDAETSKMVAGDYTIAADEITQEWLVVDLTEQELKEVELEKAAQTQTDTNAVYNTLPVEYRAAFAPLYVSVKDFLSRGDFKAAYAIIERQDVPPELETIKDQLLERIGENIPV